MKFKVLLAIVLIIILTACTSAKQTVVSDEVIFYGEGDDWNVLYIYDPELYEEKKVNWMEIEWKDSELSQKEIDSIDIEIESREGLLAGNLGNMKTKLEGHVISFLVGTIHSETYEEDEYKITIKFKDKKDVIKLRIKR